MKGLRQVALQNVKNPELWLQVKDDELSGNVRKNFLHGCTSTDCINSHTKGYNIQQIVVCVLFHTCRGLEMNTATSISVNTVYVNSMMLCTRNIEYDLKLCTVSSK